MIPDPVKTCQLVRSLLPSQKSTEAAASRPSPELSVLLLDAWPGARQEFALTAPFASFVTIVFCSSYCSVHAHRDQLHCATFLPSSSSKCKGTERTDPSEHDLLLLLGRGRVRNSRYAWHGQKFGAGSRAGDATRFSFGEDLSVRLISFGG
jgi:hypothetical protein